jgi:hypothetical protein
VEDKLVPWTEGHVRRLIREGKLPADRTGPLIMLDLDVIAAHRLQHDERQVA